jgi:adenylate cyclase
VTSSAEMTAAKDIETTTPPPLDARSLERKIWRRIALANLVGAIPINLYLVLNADQYAQKIQLKTAYGLLPVAVYIPAYVYSRLRAKHLFGSIASWMTSTRAPSQEERRATIDHPRRLALISLWCWLWALLSCFIVGEVVFVALGFNYLTIVATVTLSTLIACSLTYLVAEDALRPLFAVALKEETTKPATVGVMPRLTLSWIVGSASYLISIAILVFVLRPARLPIYVVGACLFGLAVGATLTIVGARSVARPLEHVRSALAKVGEGDLDVSVTVDDAGEIGQLQAGFNRMVSGLRERDRLKQLFDRHVGPDVARRAFDSSGLGGAELDATVMFVDLIGSTSLAAERPPDSVLAMLNALFSAVVQEVGAEGGLVNQFQGDGALCVFGAPQEVPDHAARALRAATALRARIIDLGSVFPGFDAAIGISSGHVVGGDVGTEDRYEYTVIGDAANVAARLTDEAKKRPGRLLVSEGTVRSAGAPDAEWLGCDELVLRGRRTPTLVFEPASL